MWNKLCIKKIFENITSLFCLKCVFSPETILFSLEEIMSSRVSKIDRSLVDSLTASIFWMLNYENTSYPWRTQTIGKHWRPRVWRVSWRIDHAQATCSFSFNQKKFSLAISQIGLYWKWQTFMKHIHLQ